MTHLNMLHEADKEVSAKPFFKTIEGKAFALQIKKDGLLKEHITPVEAMLVCVVGKVIFEDEKGTLQTLEAGAYIHIEPMVKHWVKGISDSQLLLLK